MASGCLNRPLRVENATLPPKRGRVMGSILKELAMPKEKDLITGSDAEATRFVPRRGMIKERMFEELVRMVVPPPPSENPTNPSCSQKQEDDQTADSSRICAPPASENPNAMGEIFEA